MANGGRSAREVTMHYNGNRMQIPKEVRQAQANLYYNTQQLLLQSSYTLPEDWEKLKTDPDYIYLYDYDPLGGDPRYITNGASPWSNSPQFAGGHAKISELQEGVSLQEMQAHFARLIERFRTLVEERIQPGDDLLGWSWGTVTVGRFVSNHPEHINRLVLYAPIISGLGEVDVTEPFHHNTWEHAADDFQKDEDGTFDYLIADPVVIEMLCSSSWHFDKESSPNGGRRDICVDQAKSLIDLKKITVPTLVICGDKDPYLDFDRVNAVLDDLPDGSDLEVIEGASHVAYIEKPYYRDFQDRLIRFLGSAQVADK